MEDLVDFIKRNAGIHQGLAFAEHLLQRLTHIEFVFDLPDYFLQKILNCHQSCRATIFIYNNGDLYVILLKVSQQIVQAL